MNKFMPATNVIFAFLGGCIAALAEHYAAKFGYTVPPDIADALPAGIALAIAHAWDLYTGENKPQNGVNDSAAGPKK